MTIERAATERENGPLLCLSLSWMVIFIVHCRFSETLEQDDGVHTSLLTLRESFDVGMTEENVEVRGCRWQAACVEVSLSV